MKKLAISEVFYSIQGEGQTMGIPSVFLRLSGCNILCKGTGWICDSIEVWKKGVKTPFKDVLSLDDVDRLKNDAHLVITGGEPMLHQKNLKSYLQWFAEEFKFMPIIEIETNGTILPEPYFFSKVDFWNCSPKLSNSGVLKKKRYNELSLEAINNSTKSIFKFVISDENDIVELMQDYGNTINMKKVVLMPAGETQNELNKTRPMVLDLCIKLGIRYSDRLHIVGWNKKTGV